MYGVVNVTSANRVVMNVLDLLPHHLFRFDDLRMTTFLPELVLLIGFVSLFVKG